MHGFRRTSRLTAGYLIAAGVLLTGCGGGSTDLGPSLPQVAGTYAMTGSVTAATCTPNQLPAGGIVVLEAFSQTFDVRIDQTGSALKLYEVGFPNDFDPGTIDVNGRISINAHLIFEETPRTGNRVFFVDLTIQRALQRQSTGQITGTATYVNIFREGSTSAPVYTTCSRQGTITLAGK